MTQAKRSTVYCGLRCIALPSPHHGKIANDLWMARLMERLHESLCLRQTTTAYVKIRQFQQDCRISCWPLFLQQFDCALRVLSDPNALCTCMRHAHTSEMRDRFARSPCIQRCVFHESLHDRLRSHVENCVFITFIICIICCFQNKTMCL